MWVSGMLASVFLTIAIVSLIIIADGFPIIDGLIAAAFTGAIGAFFGGIVYAGYRSARARPADVSTGGDIEGADSTDAPARPSIQDRIESWDGEAAGEEAAERINNVGPAVVAALPGWTWTAGVLLGIALHLSQWVVTGQDSEIGIGVALLGGIIVSFVSVVGDTHRVKWSTEYAPRWWFWTIPAMIPLFGWIFGLAWLIRKRLKTGSVVA
jgi:hypothetical protein